MEACLDTLRAGVVRAVEQLASQAAQASTTFAMAPPSAFVALSRPFLVEVESAWADALERLDLSEAEEDTLTQVLRVERAWLQGLLEGGVVVLTLRESFPEGDWDEERPVTEALSKRLVGPLTDRMRVALLDWADDVGAARARPSREPNRPPDADVPPPPPSSTPSPVPQRRAMPPAEPPTQIEGLRPLLPPAKPKDRLELLLAYAGELGVRIKKVPTDPTPAWLEKLQTKLEEIGAKRGVPSPFSFAENDDTRGTEETMAFVLPPDPRAEAARQARIEQMLAKAERAGLKLGSIPDQPSDDWLTDLEEKLDIAMEAWRRERRERREKIARQRKERIARLQAYAAELDVDLGKIPPFPTEDWLTRAERRIAGEMLPKVEGVNDKGRAERLATLLARASDAEVELEVPPDPDDVWLGWAESQVDKALGGGVALAVDGDPDDQHQRVPTLLFEEDTVQEQRWPIPSEQERFTIGRARNNDIQIRHDGQLSRQHCAIDREGDRLLLSDLRSTQGTKLNGQPVRGALPLTPGDVITIGDTKLVFRLV
ncbi:MAG: FHA domain-containing protein [Myxococcales bacterium]|nr:FHA domain-containing protein [Myxococcales bacterium]